MRKRTLGNRRGLTLLEVMIAMVILAAVMLSVGRNILFLGTQSVDTQDRAFAAQKAIQMMEELRGLISNTNNATIGVLDDYDDGAVNNPILTTRREVSDPADVLSGNARGKFVRRVSVVSIPSEPLARRIYVRVFRAKDMKPLAETVSVLRTISNQFASSQVFDVYVIAVENVPGWWVALSEIKPMFDNIVQDLQTRNPGLEWRTHWVTRMSYGRDPYYTPYVNDAVKTEDAAPPSVYFYPGATTRGGNDFEYYVPTFFQGRVKVDSTVINDGTYALADQYNHAVRYPDEVSLYASHRTAAAAAGLAAPEISLRMLLEKLNTSPEELENALIVNLHGELLPVPPVRNYSDPAKEPSVYPNVRVVSHPENLEYASGAQVKLRAYAYVTDPDAWAADAALSTMTVLLPGLDLAAGQISIRKVVGNGALAYAWQAAVAGTDYTVTYPATGQTLITLYNTPLRHGLQGNNGGIPATDRLYGLEYIPCNPGAFGAFNEGTMDLAWSNSTRPKNTARWVITFAANAVPDGMATFETRIGDDPATGTAANELTNVSRTYAWVASDVPATERFQFLGDPRHMPYVDVKLAHGYNWYFTDPPSSDWEGYTRAENGWGGPQLNVDVPRLFRLYREGVINSGSLFNSITGFSFYYVGLGGEMGYDADNGFASGLRIRETPWDPDSSSEAGVNEITDGYDHSRMRLIARDGNGWFGLHWLGELYPDSEFSTWTADGNLPVGTGNFYRANYNTFPYFSFNPYKRTNDRGAPSFFNGGSTASTWFSHEYWDTQNSALTSTGQMLAQDFNFPMLTPLTTRRPFRLNSNDAGRRPPEWNASEYSSIRARLSTQEVYYDPTSNTSTHDASALVRAELDDKYGNFVMNGLSNQGTFGAAQIGKICAINLVRGFMTLGAPAVTDDRIPQMPLVVISSPTATDDFVNPSTISVSWNAPWTRWDGQAYTSGYPSAYNEGAAMTFNVKYSNNNGRDWYFIQDGAPAQPGVRDDAHSIAAPYTWNAATQPEGSYIIRVEGFRDNRQLHYTYHQRQIYVFR